MPHGKIHGGHNRGIQNAVRQATAHHGRIWPQILSIQSLFRFLYGWVWLAMAYGLGFTRERSKVRSLVRPSFFARKASTGLPAEAFGEGGPFSASFGRQATFALRAATRMNGDVCPVKLKQGESEDRQEPSRRRRCALIGNESIIPLRCTQKDIWMTRSLTNN